MLVYNTVDYAVNSKREKPPTSETPTKSFWFLKLIQTNTSPCSVQQLKGNAVRCSTMPSETKDYWSEFSDVGSLAADNKHVQNCKLRTESVGSVFIGGWKMKAPSVGWTDTAATQLPVFRKSRAESGGLGSERHGEEKVSSQKPVAKPSRRFRALADWCTWKTLVNRSVPCSAEGSEVETPECIANISTGIVWIVAVFCSRDRLRGDDKANSDPAIGPRHWPALWIQSRERWMSRKWAKQSCC